MSGSEAARGLDWRGPVLAAATWAGVWAGTSGSATHAVVVLASAAAVVTVGWWRSRWLIVACGVAMLAACVAGGARAWLAREGPIAHWAGQGAVVTLVVRVEGGRISDSGRGGPSWTATGTVISAHGRGERWASGATVRLSASGELTKAWARVPAGETISAVVRLSPAAADEPVSAWARARASPQVVAGPGPLDSAVTTVRAGLRASVAGLPEGPRALVPALVVGDTDGMPEQLRERFRTTGLTHLTAVSGANLTLLLVALLWAAARLGVVGWWRRGVAVVGVVAFVLLCRAEPSVLRAAAMGLVGLAALGWGGTRQGMRYLSWAVIGLLHVDPWLCRSLGFVLSVFASAGIILWAGRWAAVLGGWLPSWLAEAVTVPIAAQLATQPVITAISGQVSVVGVVANLLAAPLVGPGTVLGFIAAGLSVVSPPLAAVAGWLAGGFAQGLVWISEVGSSLPGAAVNWPAGPLSLAVLAVGCVALLAGLPWLWRRPWLVGLVVVALVLLLARPAPIPGWPPERWQVVSCDVGQGDATVIATGQGRAIVVDAGPEPALVDRCLDQLGITEVPWLVLTHLHADHVGGVAGVASGRRVDRVLYSGIMEPAGGWRLVEQTLAGVPRTVASPGMVVAAGEVRLAVLAVRPFFDTGAAGEDSADQNDSSIVMRVTTGELRILLGGDLEEAGQGNAVATVPDLSAEVLLVPHHGSAHQLPAFLDAVHESVALVSVGEDNDYGHPAARTLATVEMAGTRVYRTDQHGAIAVARDDDQLVVTTQRGG